MTTGLQLLLNYMRYLLTRKLLTALESPMERVVESGHFYTHFIYIYMCKYMYKRDTGLKYTRKS